MSITRPTAAKSSAGFTLLELLLVISLIAVLGSIAIPTFAMLLGDRRLVRAANEMSEEMMRLRLRAMREGRTMILDGELEQGVIRIRPFQSLADSIEAYDQTGSQSAMLTGADQATVTALQPDAVADREIQLPDEVVLQNIAVVSAARAAAIEQQTVSDQTGGFSRPILFYPDGTTSTAALTLKHATDGTITIKMRGITGDVTVGTVQAPAP
ncbi:pilus assembly FimT family protein [Stieleria varia]|uniref:Type II secretion system protein H n=1 Tax=Stieleria varia TaxID=2528005 RepID=A0A5C6BAZ1_9BACT|nr:prepilin-type N-terminal cleavage/methylation domain-containing protein [Stieleria varia]TWU07684.1 hypothetical protein Pla52n_02570 [Stieleria varia]